MSVRVLVVGIGSGDPAHLTGAAVAALNAVDVFLVPAKEAAKADLAALRTSLCAAVVEHDRYRVIEVADPERDREAGSYLDAVRDWHQARAERYAAVIREQVDADGCVGFLVWGDPSLYDSTIRIVEAVAQLGVDLTLTVVPGISSVALLAARHAIVLNGLGRSVHITTARRLLQEYDPALGDVVVVLDGRLGCAALAATRPDLEIYWGAQLGLPDEVLVHGRLAQVMEEIEGHLARIRAVRGWVFDTYLLRPPAIASDPPPGLSS